MRVILQGSLRHFAARELLSLFGGHAHSGTFDAESGGKRVRLAFRGGRVVAAEASGANDPADVVAALLRMDDGAFNFLDEAVVAEGAEPLDLELDPLIAAAEERASEANRAAQLFPDANVAFRVVNKPPGEINLVPEEFQLLFQIGMGKTLAQLLADTRRDAADLYPIVKRLQMAGLIEPIESKPEPGPEPRPEPRPEPKPDLEATMREAPPASPAASVAEPAPARPPAPPRSAEMPAPPLKTVAEIPTPARAMATVATPLPEMPAAEPRPQRTEEKVVGTLTADDGTMHPLLEDNVTIGRTGSNTIAIKDPSVSAQHARLARTREGFTIEDTGSRNGTFVNGDRISEKRLLADGDLVRLGKVILTFNLAAEIRREAPTVVEKIPS